MPDEIKIPDPLLSEANEALRDLVSALRSVKLYPPNNPAYSLSVKKALETLGRFLTASPDCRIGVQKAYFTYGNAPLGKDAQLNRSLAQDLFAKGLREFTFSRGVTEEELLYFCRALALSSEELAMKSGMASVLWEQGATHIKVVESGLDEVVAAQPGAADAPAPQRERTSSGRTLVLAEIAAEPAGFGAGMVERAKQTRAAHESVEDRLFHLYVEEGRAVLEKHADQSGPLFEGLAHSVLTLEPSLRDCLIGGKLYGDLDADASELQKNGPEEHAPSDLHEIQSGRYSNEWTVEQVATLLKKSSAKTVAPPSRNPHEVAPLSDDLGELAREMADYTPEELETLRLAAGAGSETDIIEAAVRTLIFLLPLVKSPLGAQSLEKERTAFFGVVHQLEDMLSYLLKEKDYDLASLIVRALYLPADPPFQARMAEAVKKNTSSDVVATAIADLRKSPKDSPGHRAVYSYLSAVPREATETLLELLADEADRTIRVGLLELVKDLGRNQIVLLGERLTDERWYFVRNIVTVLGETKADQALAFLQKAGGHANDRIRQEVVKGLLTIGGKKAAGLLARFLTDKDAGIRLMAIRGLAEIKGSGAEEARLLAEFLPKSRAGKRDRELELEAVRALMKIGGPEEAKALAAFLSHLRINKKERDLALEGITALAKLGGPGDIEGLKPFTRVRWWRPRELQRELRAAALRAMEQIKRRKTDAGRSGG